MRTARLKAWLGSYMAARVIIGAAVVFAFSRGDWVLASFLTLWIVFSIVRFRFFPGTAGRRQPLHPPNESTLQFLRKRRRSGQ